MTASSSDEVSILPLSALKGMRSEAANDAGEFFFTADWFDLLARTTLDPQDQVRLFCVGHPFDEGFLCMPTIQRNAGSRSSALAGLANYYSSLYGPVFNGPENYKQQVATVVSAIADVRPRYCIVDFHPLDPNSIVFSELMLRLRQCGYWVDSYFCFGNWYLDVQGDFKQYFASRSSQLRNTVTRAQRKLERDSTFSLRIQIAENDALPQAIADYETVYSRSWKQPEPHPAFIPELCRLAARKGWLRLGIVELAGEPVAAQIWLVVGRKASIFKLAYDERLSKTSVGSVLTTALLRQVIDTDKVVEVDYLTGDDEYKKAWMSHRRERRGIVAYSPKTLRGLIEAGKHFGRSYAKTMIGRAQRLAAS